MERAQGRRDVARPMGWYQQLDLDDRFAYIKQRNGSGAFDNAERWRGAILDHVSTFDFERMSETRYVARPRPTEPDVIRATER